MRSLARRPVVARAQLGSGDAHLFHAGGAHLRGEMDDSAVVFHVLEFVLLGGLHVDHRVLVHLFLKDNRLWKGGRDIISRQSLNWHYNTNNHQKV